jgi:hypothetical protein
VSRKARLGVVCVVWIRRGVERLVPVGATNLADEPLELPSPCRLSVGSVKELLAVVASFSQAPPEEAHTAETPPATAGPTRPAVTEGPAHGSLRWHLGLREEGPSGMQPDEDLGAAVL